jgi:hypothetical protein
MNDPSHPVRRTMRWSASTARFACCCFIARCPDECRPPLPCVPAATPAFCRSATACRSAAISSASLSAPCRRARSPASRMNPFTNRNDAVSSGLLKTVRNVCSSATPARPTGIVARMIIQASIWSVSCGWNRAVPGAGAIMCPIEAKKPLTIRSQSRQK